MKSIIIGTAGHVDHGKTALVKALTGIHAPFRADSAAGNVCRLLYKPR